MRHVSVLALMVMVVLAGCGGVSPGRLIPGKKALTAPCPKEATPGGAGGRLADPSADRIGWENGIWYNESIAVDQSNGLTCAEMELVLARTMARVERIRNLEFETAPSVKVIPRERFRKKVGGTDTNVSSGRRALANIKYEALFLVNESADAIAVKRRNRAESVAGFYAPERDTVVLLTNDLGNVQINSGILVHELVHALQDQHFPNVAMPGVEDTANAHRGITEGDAKYVEQLYERRCKGRWLGTCLQPDERNERQNDDLGLANVGLYVISFQPYSDGPRFVQQVRARGGWEAVNEVYRNPPASTEQTIHPRLYPEESPGRVGIRDRSTDEWKRVTPPNQADYETWGESGLFTMFLYPAFESPGNASIASPKAFRASRNGTLDPYNYSYVASAGWDGDRLVGYRNGDGQYAYVWTVAFDDARQARQFLDGYRKVLRFRDARRVDGRPNVWRIPPDEPFTDTFYVERTGDTVLIVNAPTVGDLDDVHDGTGRE